MMTINRETISGAKHVSYPDHPEWDKPIDLSKGVTVNFISDHTDFFGGYSWKAGESAILTKPEAERALFEGRGTMEPLRKLIKINVRKTRFWSPETGDKESTLVTHDPKPFFAAESHARELIEAGSAVDFEEWKAAEVKPESLYREVAEKFLSGEYE